MAIPKIADYALSSAAVLPDNRVNWSLDPKRAVLLIHDMQQYFVNFYAPDSVLMQQVLQHIQQLIRWAKQHQVPVIYTAQPGDQDPQDRALLTDFWGNGLAANHQITSIVSALSPAPEDIQYTKWRYSAFKRSPLQQDMQSQGRDQLLICGIYAHIGILSTALEAFMLDIQPFVVADAVADFSLAEHQMALSYIAGRCGRVVCCEQVLPRMPAVLTLEQMKQDIAACLMIESSQICTDDHWMYLGLDSIRMMMLVDQWQQAGAAIQFADLAELETVQDWYQAIVRSRLTSDEVADA